MAQSETNGFVKLDRGILNWEWYEDTYTARLFFHCILKANWKAGNWKGQPYERGQFITSLPSLAKELGCSERNIRTALKHLISTGEVTSKTTNRYRIITVCNYDKYQSTDRQTDRQVTGNRQASDRQVTADEEYKEIKNKRSNNIYVANFECIWKIYPRKQEKALAYKKYNARLAEGYSEDELMTATKAYADECKKKGTAREYIKLAKTFFGENTPFIDYLKAGEENAVQETEAERQQRLADEYNAKYANRY